MIRRALIAAAFVLALAGQLRADCSGLTTNLNLADCTIGTSRSISDPAWINNFKLLDLGAVAPLVITTPGSPSPMLSLGTVGETKGGTGQTTFTLGDTLYATGTNTLGKLNGNVATTRKFRQQHGNGTAVTSDSWDTIAAGDITSGVIATARIVNSPSNSRCLRTDSSGLIQGATTDCAAAGAGDSVQVNTTNVTDANFADATPAALNGGTNVTWRTSGTGPASISAHIRAADATNIGVATISAQTFAGKKTFTGGTVGAGPQGSASLTPGSITANTCSDVSLGVTVQTSDTVTQAAVGDGCVLGTPAAGPGTHISATCYFSAASTAKVRFCNSNTSNQTATTGTYKVTALQ